MTSPAPSYVMHGAEFVNVRGNEHIRATPGQSVAEAAGSIRTPANVILAAHGQPEGTFLWNLGEKLPYADLLGALPREGVHSVTITSCYGGTALSYETLRMAPPGTIVQTIVSESSKGVFGFTKRWGDELRDIDRPGDAFIVALDNFDPQDYERQIRYLNATYHESSDHSPDHALPHVIGIGGTNPQRIDLDDTITRLAASGATLATDKNWASSVSHVQSLFDTVNLRMNPDAPDEQMMSGGDEHALDDAIAAVAKKIERGERPANVEERRIAYGLAAAYMDASGELARMQAKAIGQSGWKGQNSLTEDTLRELEKTTFRTVAGKILNGEFSAVKQAWKDRNILASIDGANGTQADGKVDLQEIQFALLRHNITSLDQVDINRDRNISTAEITATLRKDSEKTR